MYQTPRRKRTQRLVYFALAVLVLVLFGIAGKMDADENRRQAEEYCDNVHSGIWPDFEEKYRELCTSEGKPRQQP